MIISFQHKGLRLFFETGSTRGIQAAHTARLARVLSFLEHASGPNEIDFPGFRLHPLRGDLTGFWSMTVSANWRVIFRFVGSDVELVDYLDYH